MKRHLWATLTGWILLTLLTGCSNPKITGEYKVWHPLTLTFKGPALSEKGEENPFLDYRLMVRFSNGDRIYDVPGYFAADGKAGESGAVRGNKWRVHFTPDQAGEWSYLATFRMGEAIAVSDDPLAGDPIAFDSTAGILQINLNDKDDPGFYSKGRLEYTGEHFLRFAGTDKAFLKGGADSPENILAYHEFDQTPPSHRYEPHVKDWQEGDPLWHKEKGKGIIGALNYLASKGMNTVYMITMNVYGDGKDVWPWVAPYERLRYDCSKLDQWEIVFSHMDHLGLMIHFVTQETENELLLDNGFTDIQRKLYYRELIARFSHHLGITWNLGEENGPADFSPSGQTDQMRKDMAAAIKSIDPYDHFVALHTHAAQRYRDPILRELLGYAHIDGPSLQIDEPKRVHQFTKQWIQSSEKAGKPWVCFLDEIGHYTTGVMPDADDPDHDDVRKYALWGNLMAGGAGCEWYFGGDYPNADLTCEDWRSRNNMWDQTRIAIEFFRANLPYSEMKPADTIVADRTTWCLAKEREAYLIYLREGGTTKLNLRNDQGMYRIQWFNPKTGGALQVGTVYEIAGSGWKQIGYAPSNRNEDWVVLVKRQ